MNCTYASFTTVVSIQRGWNQGVRVLETGKRGRSDLIREKKDNKGDASL